MVPKLERVVNYKAPGPSRKLMITSVALAFFSAICSVWFLPLLNSFFKDVPRQQKKYRIDKVEVKKKVEEEKVYRDKGTAKQEQAIEQPALTKTPLKKVKLPEVDIPLEMAVVKLSISPQTSLQFDELASGLADSFAGAGVGKLFFELDEVDQAPVAMKKLRPFYPFRARRRGVEGQVTLRFVIKKDGKTENIEVVSSRPAGFFEESAVLAVKKWEFKPATKDGKPVAVKREVPIKFSLDD